MAKRCDICKKGPSTGNTVSHANNKKRTRNLPNVQRVKVRYLGTVKRMTICTRCIRNGAVEKAA